MIEWWPLIRHSNHAAWSKIRGWPAACLWARLGAELLLRAHEELAHLGALEPLPEVSQRTFWTPLHDRVTPGPSGPSLESSLNRFGLSPHPKVLLLLEGDTEMLHLPRVLELVGLGRASDVRLQHAQGSKVKPQLLARYAITPLIQDTKTLHLERHPTALVVAMDPDPGWKTDEEQAAQRGRIQSAVADEVAAQGVTAPQGALDFLVEVFVWGDQTYELANFSVEDIADALLTLAPPARRKMLTSRIVRAAVQRAFDSHEDIKKAFEELGFQENKPALAQLLWPKLRGTCERELDTGDFRSPVLRLALLVRDKVLANSRGGYDLGPLPGTPVE